jgi:hypothetical protein
MWESHVPDDVSEWLTQDEQQKLNAYRHVRDKDTVRISRVEGLPSKL